MHARLRAVPHRGRLRGEPILAPLLIDEPALRALAQAGYRWKVGRAGAAGYRWLLPPDWVLAAELPSRQPNGVQPVCGGGDREGRFTAVLAVVRGGTDSPMLMVGRGALPGARIGMFSSRSGPVAERLEEKSGDSVVTTVHAVTAGNEPHRFLIAATGRGTDAETQRRLRLLGLALSFTDELTAVIEAVRRGGPLHG